MKILSNLLAQIHYSASLNMSGREAVFLLLLAGLAWMMGRKKPMVLCAYSIFLILYITLLRRAPGYNEQIHLHLRFWPEAGVWAGNLLNLFLYIPFGWSFVQWKRKSGVWQILLTGFVLSVFCKVRLFANRYSRKYRQKVTVTTLFPTAFQLLPQTPHVRFHE